LFFVRDSGWRIRNEKTRPWNVLGYQCEGYGVNATSRCIQEQTYKLQELIEDAWLENPKFPTNKKLSVKDRKYWTPDFTLTWVGMCYNLDIKDSKENNLIHLFLNINLTFIVFIHDPKYFLNSNNPQTISMTTWIVPKQNTFERLSLVETEHEELNVPDDPCEEDTEYNFSSYVKRSLSSQIGCRRKWDMGTAANLTICNSLEKFR
jgi:hypothetical protein